MTADHFDPDALTVDWPDTPAGLFPTGHPDGPPASTKAVPTTAAITETDQPGIGQITLPDGTRHTGYLTTSAPQPPAPQSQPIPRWAKTTALLMLSGSTAIGISAAGLAFAADSLDAIARGMVALAIVAACIAAAVIAVAVCFRRDRGPKRVVKITQNVTATGWLGTAKGGNITSN